MRELYVGAATDGVRLPMCPGTARAQRSHPAPDRFLESLLWRAERVRLETRTPTCVCASCPSKRPWMPATVGYTTCAAPSTLSNCLRAAPPASGQTSTVPRTRCSMGLRRGERQIRPDEFGSICASTRSDNLWLLILRRLCASSVPMDSGYVPECNRHSSLALAVLRPAGQRSRLEHWRKTLLPHAGAVVS